MLFVVWERGKRIDEDPEQYFTDGFPVMPAENSPEAVRKWRNGACGQEG
jgi:hypothetical protein